MEKILNNRLVRIIFGLVIGVPLTLIALVTGAHGLLLGYGGIVKGELLWVAIGLITIIGFIGICGAWIRILKPSNLMTDKNRQIVRAMLLCGVVSSLSLSVWSYVLEKASVVAMMLVILTIGGMAFVRATPKAL